MMVIEVNTQFMSDMMQLQRVDGGNATATIVFTKTMTFSLKQLLFGLVTVS